MLKCLSATDLALASCVWSDLGADWSIWADLCRRTWRGLSLKGRRPKMGWRQLYMLLGRDRQTTRGFCILQHINDPSCQMRQPFASMPSPNGAWRCLPSMNCWTVQIRLKLRISFMAVNRSIGVASVSTCQVSTGF